MTRPIHRLMQRLSCVFLVGLATPMIACAPRTKVAIVVSEPTPADPTAIQDRALETFSKGIFYKPKESTNFPFDITLAPLIVQEVRDPLESVLEIAPYPITGPKKAQPAPQLPSIIVLKRNARGATRDREGNMIEREYVIRDFMWRYPGTRKLGKDIIPEARGVRVFSNKEEKPLVWQVLDNCGGPTILYVSTELEKAAAEQFGAPLSGRKYSIERGLDEKPNVVVARVIEAGPVPMGPYVYLSSEDQSVTSIVCRCMSSQVNEFVETKYYELSNTIPLTSTGGTWFTKWTIEPELNPEWDSSYRSIAVQSELRWPVLKNDELEQSNADHSSP